MTLTNRAYRAPGATAYLDVAHVPSNAFYGSSMIYAKVYAQTTLDEDSLILDLVGGLFVVLGDGTYKVRFTKPPVRFDRNNAGWNPLPETAIEVPYRDGMYEHHDYVDAVRLDEVPGGAAPFADDWLVPAEVW